VVRKYRAACALFEVRELAHATRRDVVSEELRALAFFSGAAGEDDRPAVRRPHRPAVASGISERFGSAAGGGDQVQIAVVGFFTPVEPRRDKDDARAVG